VNTDFLESSRITKRGFLRYCSAGMGLCLLKGSNLDTMLCKSENAISPLTPADEPGRFSKAAWFVAESGGDVQCLKCPHFCLLGPGQSGKCRNRVNYNGTVYEIGYGNPCAVHVDPIEKKPLLHFLPSTQAFSIAVAGCNLRCLNCQNWQISQMSPRETENVDLMPARVVEEAAAVRCATIAYTYSEPNTFYQYAYDTASLARKKGIRSIWKSSGYINEEPLRKLCRVIDAANIDLKGFDEEVYQKLNCVSLGPVLQTLKILKEEGVWLEITNLVVPSWTDDLATIRRMCEWLVQNGLSTCPLHFSRFTPLYKLSQLPSTPVSILERARESALKAGMRYVYIGNVPGHDAMNTYCHKCGIRLVERKGFSVLSNRISAGACPACGEKIPGVWQ
jgi:pyruvate formate lyase activating enzyme